MSRFCFLAILLFVPIQAMALTVEDTTYPDTVTMEGRTLHLVGAGMREKTIFKVDVYTMAVYVEKHTCNQIKLVHTDQAKLLRMDFVRDIPADKMKATMTDNFTARTPKNASGDLQGRINRFLALFNKKVLDKTQVRIIYVPGRGTSIYIDGKKRGATITGPDFQNVLMDIWFNRDTCCPHLLEDIRATCTEKK
ncbi:MAG: chalcone isomerase family protein [Deltaproteobacteria bacterium]|nr:chalcone isomerase family protein [Deltaproteobacteria bacterium]